MRDDAAHGQLLLRLIDCSSSQRFSSRGRCEQIERRGDLGALGAGAHDLGAGAAARQQLQRIDDDGLAGAGLAGEHREPGLQFELDRVDDREVANLQVGQHACAYLEWSSAAAAPVQLGAQQAK